MQLATQLAILATCVAGLCTLDLRNATASLNKILFRILGIFSYLIKFVSRSISIRIKNSFCSLWHRHLLNFISSIKLRIISWLNTIFTIFHYKYATVTVSKLPHRWCVADNRVLCNVCCKKSATDVAVAVICCKCGRALIDKIHHE